MIETVKLGIFSTLVKIVRKLIDCICPAYIRAKPHRVAFQYIRR